ncbi:MAG: ATP-dependent 6-phosphofructokinase [Spirochaetota bacterium]|nr:ATP-dependent 6-phosphofructokinase [Spirochaetota bacterium]
MNKQFVIKDLGKATHTAPSFNLGSCSFVADDERVLYDVIYNEKTKQMPDPEFSFEKAGPRKTMFFDPKKTKAAIVTCGGLCPGINDVIRAIVRELYFGYGVHSILGILYGYNGLINLNKYKPITLDPEYVDDIHTLGGTVLGSSRGGGDKVKEMVDNLEFLDVNILFTIGGDGTLKGAHGLVEEIERRGLKISIVGIPKTIDNDISYIQSSFGFETAFSLAVNAITSASIEADNAPMGIGLVKLMGRHSGFIATNATLAMNDVNFVFVPEVPFKMDGPDGFLFALEKRLLARDHAVICMAEGAAQDILVADAALQEKDASNNVKLEDVGIWMKNRIIQYFKSRNLEVNLKYIDPSYMIRSAPACPNDSLYCLLLGQNAVHAAMNGKTDLIIGRWNNIYTHVPITLATSKRKYLNANSIFWRNLMSATRQPLEIFDMKK